MRHFTLDTFEHHLPLHALRLTHATSHFRGIAARPVLIVTCVQSSDVIITRGSSILHVSRLRIKENSPSVHTEIRRRTFHCWTTIIWFAGKFQLSYVLTRVHSASVVASAGSSWFL